MSKAKPAQPLGRRPVPVKAPAYVRGRDVRAKLLHLLELGGMPGRQIFIDSFQFCTAGRVPGAGRAVEALSAAPGSGKTGFSVRNPARNGGAARFPGCKNTLSAPVGSVQNKPNR